VTLTAVSSSGAELRAHPLGSLTFHQHTVPLNQALERFGSAIIAGPSKLALTAVTYGTTTVQQTTPVDDQFAPGQFLNYTDADALSKPSFANYQAGLTFTPTGPDYDELAIGDTTTVDYTIDLIDQHGQAPNSATSTVDGNAAARQLPTSPSAGAPSRTTGARRYQSTPGTIAVLEQIRAGAGA
jgi:hypothetical protein